MNLILLALLIPFSSFGADLCTDLGVILTDYEKDFGKSKVDKCNETKVDDLIKGHVGLTNDGFLETRKCYPLTAIEAEAENLKAQLSVLNGIAKLKATVDESQKSAANGSRVAGMTFVSSLNTAQPLEILLDTNTLESDPKNSKSFIQKLKELPADQRKNQQDLSNAIKQFCHNMAGNVKDACDQNVFRPNADTVKEILKLVESTNDVSDAQIDNWKSMLAIQRADAEPDKSKWSFTEMQQELEGAFAAIDNNQVMSREHLNAIKKLDNFKHAPGFSFVEDIAAAKDMNKRKILQDKLLVLMGDARNRQEYEAQSKLSVVLENYKTFFSSLPDDQKASCDKARFLATEARICLAHLEKKSADSSADMDLKQTLLSIKTSLDYAAKVSLSEIKCKNELVKSPVLPESCYEEVSKASGDLQNQIRQLNILKEKIGIQLQDEMIFRNFALRKWTDKCKPVQSSMDQCDMTEDYIISKNALMAISDSMKVAIVYTPKPEVEEKAKALCKEGKKQRKNFEQKLCEMLESTPFVAKTVNQSEDEPAPRPPELDLEGEINRDRMIAASTYFARDVLGSVLSYQNQQRYMQPLNPYQYNFAPYNYGMPPMGIAQSIEFPARYYGAYGFYMPTPGYQPYTAFGINSPVSSYKSINTTYPSRYFGK